MRYPAVSGSFYPSSPTALSRQVNELMAKAREAVKPHSCKAIVCPHAGFAYSGLTAAYSFAAAEKELQNPDTTAIILGPNHTGIGELVSVSLDTWATPIGKSDCDLPLAGALAKAHPLITRSEPAHFREHSIEVQLPFIQTINPAAKIVPVCLMAQDGRTSEIVGQAIFEVAQKPEFSDRNILVIASSDFEHYLSGAQAKQKDALPLKHISRLDDAALQSEVESQQLSICGHGAIAATLHYARMAGCEKAELLRYTNSGKETDGDESKVVAYASFAIN